jgi:branched-chain amino acid transport system permease protein
MFLQLLFNSIVSGLLLALVAVGFNLIFNTTKVFHLAHAGIYVFGSYLLMMFLNFFGAEQSLAIWLVSIVFCFLVIILLSSLIEWLVYYPLAKKNSGQAITLISSMGVYILLVNIIALKFGNEAKFMNVDLGKSITLINLTIVPIQLAQLAIAVFLLTSILLFQKSKVFLRVRAVMSEQTVASVLGVNTKKIRLLVIIVGGLLAAIASILKLYDTGITPYAGMTITLTASAAVIIGGSNSLKGTIIASLLIATLQTMTEWFLSSQWKDGMTFLLLIFVILWRTEGIVSFKMRVEEK